MPTTGDRVIAGRYLLEEPIGQGGMGVVWRARDRTLKRTVALKQVRVASADEEEAAALYRRLEREAQIAASLSHPGIVTVHDVLRDEDGLPWIVMQYVESQSLEQLVAAQGPLTALRTGRIGQQLLDALAAAHEHGVLHRDVKPSNVLIAPGRAADGRLGGRTGDRAVLTDFGIALSKGDTRLTLTDQMSPHTAGFTAPERCRGEDATAASDLWSLGATLFATVEGYGPFQRDSYTDIMYAVAFDPLPAAPSAGSLLGQLILALLARDPSARPSAADAAGRLAEILPLMAGEAGPLSFLNGASSRPAPLTEPALTGEPTATAAESADSRPASRPQSGSDLLQDFDWESGDSRRSARRVRRLGPVPRGRTTVIAAGAVVFIVAIAVIGFALFKPRPHPGKNLSSSQPAASAASSGSGTASASASLVSLPPLSRAAGVAQAIDQVSRILPAGYKPALMPAATTGTTAGFSLDIPQNWTMNAMGQQTYQYTPTGPANGVTYVEIDLTTDKKSSMLAEAMLLAGQPHQATYPGYRPVAGHNKPYVQPEPIRGTAGALWQFDYGSGHASMRMDVLLFTLDRQSYTVYMTAPAGASDTDWNTITLPLVNKILHTFEPLG